MHHSRKHTLVHGITEKQKQLINISTIKVGLSGDLLGSFRGIATTEATKAASVKIFRLSKLKC